MNRYFIEVGQDGSEEVTHYQIHAETALDARIIAFAMDGGLENGQRVLEEGDVALVEMWTTVVMDNNDDRIAQLTDRVKLLEVRLAAVESHNHRLASVVTSGIIDSQCSPPPPTPSQVPDCRPCKPNPISFRKGTPEC